MIATRKENDEVLYVKEMAVTVAAPDLAELRRLASLNPRRRIRLCTHQTAGDHVHEMIIYHPKGAYVRPHKHVGKEESFHLVYGEVDLVLFDESGGVVRVVGIGDYTSGKPYYYKIPAGSYHTQLFRKDTVFHEVTEGPFNPRDTVLAKWGPAEQDVSLVNDYVAELVP